MRHFACILVCLLLHPGVFSQDMAPDTTLNLEDVTIYSSRISKFAKGQGISLLDSNTRCELPVATLAEIIPGFTSAYIRNYGPGTLSTLSFRGTSANHTALLWNGIRLAPPNIGYVDLSLIQGNFFHDISLLHGGASPMFGSGSVGASVHLENKPVFSTNGNGFDLSLSAGSFGMFSANATGTVSRKKFYAKTAFSFAEAENDLKYEDINGDRQNMEHAAFLRSGFLQDIALQLPRDQYFMASTWFQYAERDIPPTLTEDTAAAAQMDRSWRTMLIWKDFNPRSTLEAKLAYFNEFTRYNDPLPSIYSVIKSQTITGSFETTFDAGKHGAIYTGVQYYYEYADLVYYSEPQDQENLAIYASYRHDFPSIHWQASVNGRQEFFTGYASPFLFSAGAEGKLWHLFSGSFSVSRNFRAPTLNERYWEPGGNPDLQPEESWNAEAGVSFNKKYESSSSEISFTWFNSLVDNWILWLPVTSSYWTVGNAQKVWSRGLELSGLEEFTAGRIKFIFAGSYTLSKSTNEKKVFELDASYQKQLIYTPIHQFIVKTGAIYKGFSFLVKGSYSGIVYTSKDNAASIPQYFLLDAVISKSLRINKQFPLVFQLNLNNLTNREYQVTPYRPMPGVNALITVKVGMER